MFEIRRHIESYAVNHASGGVVDKFEFDMFEVAAHKFARAEVFNTTSAECRFAIAGTEWVEQTQDRHKFRCYIGKRKEGVDIELRR